VAFKLIPPATSTTSISESTPTPAAGEKVGKEPSHVDPQVKCDNCHNKLSKRSRRGPNNETLCNACGQRYSLAVRTAANTGTSVGDSWRQKKKAGSGAAGTPPCSNHENCGRNKGVWAVNGPDGPGTLCHDCGQRYREALKAAKANNTDVGDDWKFGKPEQVRKQKPTQFDHTCGDCGRHEAADWHGELCDLCHQRRQLELQPRISTLDIRQVRYLRIFEMLSGDRLLPIWE
jgi:hypothetical protein